MAASISVSQLRLPQSIASSSIASGVCFFRRAWPLVIEPSTSASTSRRAIGQQPIAAAAAEHKGSLPGQVLQLGFLGRVNWPPGAESSISVSISCCVTMRSSQSLSRPSASQQPASRADSSGQGRPVRPLAMFLAAGACCSSGQGPLGCAGNPKCATDTDDSRRRRRPQPSPAAGPPPTRTSILSASADPQSDLELWLDLLAAVFAGKTTRSYFQLHWEADLAASRSLENVFVAWDGPEVVGSVRLYQRTVRARTGLGGSAGGVRCAGVGEVATRSSHRGRGVASSLLDLATEAMRGRLGTPLSVLHTSSAPALYQRHG